MNRPNLARRAAAEGLAAFALVFAGCGAIIANAKYGGALGSVGVSLVFGLIIMVMIYATGHPPLGRFPRRHRRAAPFAGSTRVAR